MGHRTVVCSYCNNQLRIEHPDTDQEVVCSVCKRSTVVKSLPFDVTELSFYAVKEPFCYISIVKEIESLKKQYIVLEPQLPKEDIEVLEFIKDTLVKTLNVRLDTLEDDAESFLHNAINEILNTYEITLDFVSYQKILYFLKQHFLQFGPIDALMNDASIEDISCDGAKTPLFVYQREFGSLETSIGFPNEHELSLFVVKLAQKCGKHISVSHPMLDATMPDGSRIQMTLSSEVTTRGSTFTIRKFRSDPITPVDLIDYKTFSLEMIAYLWMAVEQGFNALISGGTASGKTSALNALALFIPKESKIVSIEETREINLPHPNWIPGVTRSGFGEVVNDRMIGEIDLFDLMKAALRQRPEYILVGEIRGQEAYVLFQAMATGHTTYSTVHADTTQALIHRLEGKPINIPRTMLQSLDIICLMRTQKTQDQQQRRCVKIVELLTIDSETNEVLTNTVFEWNFQDQVFEYSGKSYILEQLHNLLDMSSEEMNTEMKNRSNILQWLQRYHIREFTDVARLLASYAETPKEVMTIIEQPPKDSETKLKESLSIKTDSIKTILDLSTKEYDETVKEIVSKKNRFFTKPSRSKIKNGKKKKDESKKEQKKVEEKPKKKVESKKKSVFDTQKKTKEKQEKTDDSIKRSVFGTQRKRKEKPVKIKSKTGLSKKQKEQKQQKTKKESKKSSFLKGTKISLWAPKKSTKEDTEKQHKKNSFFKLVSLDKKQPHFGKEQKKREKKPKKLVKKKTKIPKVRLNVNSKKLKNNSKKRLDGEL